MSFYGSHDEAIGIIKKIQEHKEDGNDGGSCSPIRDGAGEPGTSMKAPISELVPKRTFIKVRTASLTRRYASS